MPIPALALASTPSFNESFNCDGPDGIRGPVVPSVGRQGAAVEVFGPWGDAFGRSIGATEESLVWWEMPFSGGYHVRVHRLALPAFEQAARNLRNAVRDVPWRDYEVRGRYTFGWHPATVPPHPYLSFHAFGTAVDINSNTNPFRTDNLLITDMPSWFVRAWRDAGFCWGGNWRDLKDPMHFSWKGPLAIPGYGSPPLPTAPRTQRTAFRQVARQSTTALDPAAGAATFVEDIDRDGAPDVVVLRPWTSSGRHRMESARARTGFETCLGAVTAPIPDDVAFVMGDYDGTGRPDLWLIGDSDGSLAIEVLSHRSGWAQKSADLSTSIPVGRHDTYLVGDHDRDLVADLYVVRRGGAGVATRLEVWDGRSGFASALVDVALPVDHSTTSSARWHFGLGDHDVDGVNDLFVMSTGSLVSVQVIDGASRFSATTRRMRSGMSAERGDLFAVADYDGDERDDLYRIGQDRSIEVRLGGLRGAGEDLDGWFRAWEGWKPGRGCVDVASGVVGAPAVDAAGGVVAAVYPGKDRGGRIMTVGGGAVDDSPLPWGMAPAAVALGPGEAIAVTGTTRNGTGRTLVSGGGAAPSDLRHKGTPVDLAWQGDTAQVLLAVDGGAVIDGVRRGRAFREVDVEDLDPTAIAVAGDHLVIVGRGVDRGELVMIDRTMGAITRFALGAGRSPLDVGVADIAGTQAVVVLEVDDADRARVRAIDRGGAAIGVSVALPASWVAVAMAPLRDGRVAVVAIRRSDGSGSVFLLDLAAGKVIRRVATGAIFDPRSIDARAQGFVVLSVRRGDAAVRLTAYTTSGEPVAMWSPG